MIGIPFSARGHSMAEARSNPNDKSVLDYARPVSGEAIKARHILALTYAAFAIPVGLVFLLLTLIWRSKALGESTSYDRRHDRAVAMRFMACSSLLVGSGVWYGRAGVRRR